MPVYGHAAKPD